jgi:hypothetical protein
MQLQMFHAMLSRGEDDFKEAKVLWKHQSVNDVDRAKAVCMAIELGNSDLLTWIFQSPCFPMEAFRKEMGRRKWGPTLDTVLFDGRLSRTAELLAAVI